MEPVCSVLYGPKKTGSGSPISAPAKSLNIKDYLENFLHQFSCSLSPASQKHFQNFVWYILLTVLS
jgi:hypothetical protein